MPRGRTHARAHKHEQCSRDANNSELITVIDMDAVLVTVLTDYDGNIARGDKV